MDEFVRYEQSGAVVTLTLDDPDARNALSTQAQWDAVVAACARVRDDPGPALRMAKRLLREGQHVRLQTLLELSAAFQALAHHSPEHGEALDAFLQAMARR